MEEKNYLVVINLKNLKFLGIGFDPSFT